MCDTGITPIDNNDGMVSELKTADSEAPQSVLKSGHATYSLSISNEVVFKQKVEDLVRSYVCSELAADEKTALIDHFFQDMIEMQEGKFISLNDGNGVSIPLDKAFSSSHCHILRNELEALFQIRNDKDLSGAERLVPLATELRLKTEAAQLRIRYFIQNIQTTIRRCQAHLLDIQQHFRNDSNHSTSYQITKIEITNSDPHITSATGLGCERVSILTLTNTVNETDTFKIVYKPRDIRLERLIVGNTLFQCRGEKDVAVKQSILGESRSLFEITNDLLTEKGKKALPTYKLLALKDGEDHFGIVAHLSYERSKDEETKSDYVFDTVDEGTNYYGHIGQYEAIAQVFGMRDLHQGNLIVHNKEPHLVDLEASFNFFPGGTALIDSVRTFGDNEDRTQNWVFSKVEHKDMIDLCREERYLNAMKEGFKDIINLYGNENNYSSIKNWLSTLPEDIKVRTILIATSVLKEWPDAVVFSSKFLTEEEIRNGVDGLSDFLTKEEKRVLGFLSNDSVPLSAEKFYQSLIEDLRGGSIPVFYHLIDKFDIYYRSHRIKNENGSPKERASDNLIALQDEENRKKRVTDFVENFCQTLFDEERTSADIPAEKARDWRRKILSDEQISCNAKAEKQEDENFIQSIQDWQISSSEEEEPSCNPDCNLS